MDWLIARRSREDAGFPNGWRPPTHHRPAHSTPLQRTMVSPHPVNSSAADPDRRRSSPHDRHLHRDPVASGDPWPWPFSVEEDSHVTDRDGES